MSPESACASQWLSLAVRYAGKIPRWLVSRVTRDRRPLPRDDAGAVARRELFGLLPPEQIRESKEAGCFTGPGGEADRRLGQERRAQIPLRVFHAGEPVARGDAGDSDGSARGLLHPAA